MIATGSLLGVQGYGDELKKQHRRLSKTKDPGINSVPVGSEDIIEMYPLDFEEFLWANGMSTGVIDALSKCYAQESPVPAGIHVALKNMLNLYVAVGGLPDAVNAFLRTNNMNEVRKVYQSILKEYRDDMVKYAPDKDKPHIRECFNSVPKQLAKENLMPGRYNGWKMQVLSAAATIQTSQDFRWRAMPRTMFSKSICPI